MAKYRVPNEKEREIIQRNGIDPEQVMVEHTSEGTIHLLYSKTRDSITIEQGDRKW